MGVGMVVVTAPQNRRAIESHLRSKGTSVYEIGRVAKGNKEVSIQ